MEEINIGIDVGLNSGFCEVSGSWLSLTWLGVGVLWFEADMKWLDVPAGETKRALAQTMLSDWLLGNCASVDDVKREIPKLRVFKYTEPLLKAAPTFHFVVYDAQGGCIVIEYEDGQCNIYDNPLGIMTNAPRFPWQLTNLRQYIGMTSEMPEATETAGCRFAPTGHGAGMIGLPGDITPPSRFVRLDVLTRFSDTQPDAERALNLSQHIINTFDIPFGMVTDTLPDKKTVLKESTQWVVFRDLTDRILYFKTHDNQNLRKIELRKLDFDGAIVKRIRMYGAPEVILDVTDQAH